MLLKYVFFLCIAISITFGDVYSTKKYNRELRKLLEQHRSKLVKKSLLSYFDALRYEWKSYKSKYNKKYGTFEENLKRLSIYAENKKRINEHNDRFNKGAVTYSLGINQYADWTDEERNKLLGYRPINEEKRSKRFVYTPPSGLEDMYEKDWKKDGAVTAIKDQGNCGAGWAFSATGAIEGTTYRATKRLVDLSEQNLIDCSRGYGNIGCEGGSFESAFKYVEENGAIDVELGYPYEGYDANTCRFNFDYAGSKVNGFEAIAEDEISLKTAVAYAGTISAAVDASGFGFHFYKSGIYYNETCSWEYTKLNHGVLIIGFGNDTSGEYWTVKNSWGTGWGEEGYIRMARNRQNNCGIATNAVLPMIQVGQITDEEQFSIENRPAFDGV